MALARGRRRRFVFLDKDGTVVEDVPYSADPSLIRFTPGAPAALRALQAAGFGLALVSNQGGVARGHFPEAALEVYWRRLRELLADEAVEIEAFLYCPHHPAGVNEYAISCDCRKPAPGLLLQAAHELGADLAASWMVGDILDDVEAGRRAGCRTVLLDAGHETEWLPGPDRQPDAVATDLGGAVEWILAETAAAGVERRPLQGALPAATPAAAPAAAHGGGVR